MMWTRKAALVCAALVMLPFLLTLTACDGGELAIPTPTTTPTSALDYNLEVARERFALAKADWEYRGSDDYIFEAEAWCLCPAMGGPFRITVRRGVIESIMDISSGEVVTDVPEPLQTIDDLFREIEGTLTGRPVPSFHAAYHFRLGYPVFFAANFSDAADDGYSLVISSYRQSAP